MTNPATRAQYDRDRLGYLYAQFKSYELFPANAAVDENNSREDQIETYATVLKDHISDPVEDKKVKIHARLFHIRNELDEYKEKSKNVQEEWATSSNQILRMSANALREVEICARADIEMLENELGDLRGQLPPKNIDGPPGRIASGQYGSEMGVQSKTKSMLAMNQRVPSIPRSPTVPVRLRSASKFGVRMGNSSTGDSSSSTSRSDSTMAIYDRIQNYLVGSVYSPTFYAPATFLDAGKRQHGVERIIARAKRQSLDPETLSDLAMVKSEKLPKQGEKAVSAGFDPVAFLEYDPYIKQKKTSHKQYDDILKKDEKNQRLANIGEMSEHQEAERECESEVFNTKDGTAQLNMTSEGGSSTSFPDQSPPGLGLVEYQQRFGCHVITEDMQATKLKKEEVATRSKKSVSAKKKFQKPWVCINDSVSMPAHLSSTRADPHVVVNPMNMESPIERPDHPFQRTIRGAASTEFTPMGKLRTKPALGSISNEIMQRELKVAQPVSRKPSQIRDHTAIIQSVREAVWEKAQVAKTAMNSQKSSEMGCSETQVGDKDTAVQKAPFDDFKGPDMAVQEVLERSISRMKKEEAARTLVELSRQGDEVCEAQQQAAQNASNEILDESDQPTILGHIDGQQVCVQQGGGPYDGPEYGVPKHGGGSQQSSIPYHSMYKHAQQSGSVYSMGPHIAPMIPTFHHRSFQEGKQPVGTLHQPHIKHASPYGAIGSEMKAMKHKKAQEEKAATMDEKPCDEEKATMEKTLQASKLDGNTSVARKGNDDPFVD